MKRRDLLVGFVSGVGFTAGNGYLWHLAENSSRRANVPEDLLSESGYALEVDPFSLGEEGIGAPAKTVPPTPPNKPPVQLRATMADALELPTVEDVASGAVSSEQVLTQQASANLTEADQHRCCDHDHAAPAIELPNQQLVLEKVRNFDGDFVDDIFLSDAEQPVIHSLFLRFKRAERLVGHGNYNLLSFDELFKFGNRYSEIGQFSPPELQLIEKLFFTEAEKYGFYGEKVTKDLTAKISHKETVKVPYSGHFLFRGDSESYYDKLRRDIGESVILTSGVRGNVKQMHLFIAKCLESNYNLSKASRSLAPPGHSYHGVGDFDVGRVGWGYSNFTDKFAETDEFKRMQDLGYVQIRYTKDNHYGVRFEPWHIKVV